MIDAQGVPARDNPIVEAIRNDELNGETLLRDKFGRGLGFLADRYCGDNAQLCVNAVITASIAAIRQGVLSTDKEIAALLRRQLHETVCRFSDGKSAPTWARFEQGPTPNPEHIISVALPLATFKSLEREILVRFYLHGQDEATICGDLKVTLQKVRSLRAAARFAARLGLKPSKPATAASSSPRSSRSIAV